MAWGCSNTMPPGCALSSLVAARRGVGGNWPADTAGSAAGGELTPVKLRTGDRKTASRHDVLLDTTTSSIPHFTTQPFS